MATDAKSVIVLGLLGFLFIPSQATAHRPIFSDQAATDPNTAVLIGQPAISQVIYREITDKAKQVWLAFDANEGFELFIQIGIPVLDRLKDFRPAMVLVGPGLPEENPPFNLPEGTGATAFTTTDIKEPRFFHEHFTGTDSWILRSETVPMPKSGWYYVVAHVPSGDNGKLWLSVGQQESFGLADWSQFGEWKKKIRKFHEVSEEGGLRIPILSEIGELLGSVAAMKSADEKADKTTTAIHSPTEAGSTDPNQPSNLLLAAIQADDTEQLKKHLEDGANVNAMLQYNLTPLHWAALGNNKEVVEILLKHGADVNAQGGRGKTALELARQRRHTDIVNLIVKNDLQSTHPQKPKHDLSITQIKASSTCTRGDTVALTVNVANHGTYKESFSVTLSDPSGKNIATKTTTLGKKWRGRADDIPDVIFDPETKDKNLLGNRVCIGGDVNNDGFKDILLGVLSWDDWRGRANVYFGGINIDTKPDVVLNGENRKDRLTDQSGAFGDVNHDGYDDVIVGAPFYPSFKADGKVYVLYGGPDMDSTPDMILPGPEGEEGWFGLMLTASDIDADGYVDILVGAQNHDSNGEKHPLYPNANDYGSLNGRGRIYIYWGGDPMDTEPDLILEGEKRGDWFGRRISANGDINGDGYNDILVGARHAGTENRGSAYLFLGNKKEEMDADCDWTFRGEGKDHQMGSSVAIFDIDADGYDDVIIGARGAAGYCGRVYVYWGSKDFDGSSPGPVFQPASMNSMGGDDIACGHFNGDKYGDILAGAYGYPGTHHMYGRAYLFYGNSRKKMDSDIDYIFEGESGKDDFFVVQVDAADLNKDGYADALIGAEGAHDDMGRAYLFYGPFHSRTDITFTWDTTNASIGKHTLKVEIPPVPGEQNTEDNIKTVTIEVKEPLK